MASGPSWINDFQIEQWPEFPERPTVQNIREWNRIARERFESMQIKLADLARLNQINNNN